MVVSIVILVPYRDAPTQNRAAHLEYFLRTMPITLDAALGRDNYRIMIGQQSADGRLFSRGRVLNALAAIAMVKYPRARLVLHDVDLIPDVERAKCYAMTMPPDVLALALHTDGEYKALAQYIGGICAVEPDVFKAVGGFDTRFEGWGGEDDAFRDALLFYGRGKSFDTVVHSPRRGTVTNLETGTLLAGTLRAKFDPSQKMPKEARRQVRRDIARELSAYGRNRCGLDQFVFYCALATECNDISTMYDLWVYVTLPPGMRQWMSSATARPYYGLPTPESPMDFALPPGTVVCKAPEEPKVAEESKAVETDDGADKTRRLEEEMRRAVQAIMRAEPEVSATAHKPPKVSNKRARDQDPAAVEAKNLLQAMQARGALKTQPLTMNVSALKAILR